MSAGCSTTRSLTQLTCARQHSLIPNVPKLRPSSISPRHFHLQSRNTLHRERRNGEKTTPLRISGGRREEGWGGRGMERENVARYFQTREPFDVRARRIRLTNQFSLRSRNTARTQEAHRSRQAAAAAARLCE